MDKDDDLISELKVPKDHVFAEGLQDQTATFNLSLRAVDPVDVCVEDLSLQIDTTRPIWETPPSQIWHRLCGKNVDTHTHKTVLDSVDAFMPSGSLTAIIGSSGSGKTSLLNIMAGRMSLTKAKVSGATTLNGVAGIEGIRSAYVMQEDVLIPTLTVRETLRYAADLRLPPPATQEERHRVVEQVILELGLKECADTRIGTSTHKGCSGGEKRRTSIGVQMLANPSVCILQITEAKKREQQGRILIRAGLVLRRTYDGPGCNERIPDYPDAEKTRGGWSNRHRFDSCSPL
jgi:ABC-type lipoprotein export system ATPase subunit